jgi:GT2 family glycosyltransferase
MKVNVVFIIITYHPDMEMLGKLLRALPAIDTVVVDNGSTLVSDDVGKATLIPQSKNIGYGAAANIGIRHAIAHGAEWFVILNQDTAMTKPAAEDCVKQLSKMEPCIAGPFGGTLDAKRWTTVLASTPGVEHEHVDYISGSCIAIHTKVVGKIGYFYEPYFLYYEEVDYCVRAKQAGFAMQVLDIKGIRHVETLKLGKGSPAHQYYLARNHMLFVERLAPKNVKVHEWARLFKTLSEHKKRKEGGALMGFRDYVLRRFGPRRGGKQ